MPILSNPQLSSTILNCRVDWGRGTLTNGGSGSVTLRPQSLAVLKMLAGKPGTIVTKDEITATIWPGIAVTDDSLVQCITEIRKALGDDQHFIIKTVPKRGYIYELPPSVIPTKAETLFRKAAALADFLCLALAAAFVMWPVASPDETHRPSIAVLPFDNLSGDAQWNKLTDGLTEDTITDLSRFKPIDVIARNSVNVYKGKAVDIREVGRALGVNYVIEGSVQREGTALRVTAQLIDAATGTHVWSQRWDRTDATNISLQDEVATLIAVEVGGILSSGALAAYEVDKARVKPVAARSTHDHLMIAIHGKNTRTKETVNEGLDAINRVLALEPNNAIAYMMRTWLTYFSTDFGADWASSISLVGADAKRGYDLDSNSSNTVATYGFYLSLVPDMRNADRLVRSALAMNPNDPHILCIAATTLPYIGYPDDAMDSADRLRSIHPNPSPVMAGCPIDAYFFGKRFETAVAVATSLLPESRAAYLRFEYAASLAFLGRKAEAETAKAAFLETRPGTTAQMFYTENWYFARDEDKKLFFDGFRALNIPMCATAEQLKLVAKPEPLPECPVSGG